MIIRSDNVTNENIPLEGRIAWKIDHDDDIFEEAENQTDFTASYIKTIAEGSTTIAESVKLHEVILDEFSSDIASGDIRIVPHFGDSIRFEILNSTVTNSENMISSYDDVFNEFNRLFTKAKNEHFEDGIESHFAQELIQCIEKHGKESFRSLISLVDNSKISSEVVSEALRWIGRLDSQVFYPDCKWLLEYSLNHRSARIRDGAILGLAAMDDPNSIQYVKKALQKEKNLILRRNMQQLLDQLNKTQKQNATELTEENETLQTMLASEDVLRREWDTKEEDEAWSHL